MIPSIFAYAADSSAAEYRDFVMARQPVMLSDLAHNMADSSGPLEAMDGSVASLVALWEWFLGRFAADFPGVPADAQPAMSKFLGWKPSPQFRAKYAAEPIVQYLFEVSRTYAPDAHWGVFQGRTRDDGDRNKTVILSVDWLLFDAEQMVLNKAGALVRGLAKSFAPNSLRERVIADLALHGRHQVAPHPQSILIPLLEQPRIPGDDPRRTPPLAYGGDSFSLPSDRGGSEDLMIADPNAPLEHPALIRPLDETVIAEGLNATGWHIDGQPVSAEALRDEHTQLLLGDSQAVMELFVDDGRLKVLNIETLQITAAQWDKMTHDLRTIAQAAGAKLGYTQDFNYRF